MGLFSFMETSFFFTLGITFLLILLLVYHFKQRIANAESKQDTMFEIINNLVQEVSKTQQALSLMNRPSSPYPVSLYSNFHTEQVKQNLHQINEEEKEEEEEEDVSDIDESDLEDSDDEMAVESDTDDITAGELSIHEMIHSASLSELIPNNETESTEDKEVTNERVEEEEEPLTELTQQDFNKMNLGGLKTYILERGWVEDASKMKKAQILSLIKEQTS
jgi:hypothetical protein